MYNSVYSLHSLLSGGEGGGGGASSGEPGSVTGATPVTISSMSMTEPAPNGISTPAAAQGTQAGSSNDSYVK